MPYMNNYQLPPMGMNYGSGSGMGPMLGGAGGAASASKYGYPQAYMLSMMLSNLFGGNRGQQQMPYVMPNQGPGASLLW